MTAYDCVLRFSRNCFSATLVVLFSLTAGHSAALARPAAPGPGPIRIPGARPAPVNPGPATPAPATTERTAPLAIRSTSLQVLVPTGAEGTSITLENVEYRTTSEPLSGTAELRITLGGKSAPTGAKPGLPTIIRRDAAFEGVKLDKGQVTEGTITVTNDYRIKDLGGSGVDVILVKGAQLKPAALGVPISGPMKVVLPYRLATGERAELVTFETNRTGQVVPIAKDASLSLRANGDFHLLLKGAKLGDLGPGNVIQGFSTGGFSIESGPEPTISFNLQRVGASGKPFDLSLATG
ncbi:MAG: hypothetical protein M3347_08750, partial [Armatimonadota bacterium]|nr:hypothetical protein [Armatimonadota bacterium]